MLRVGITADNFHVAADALRRGVSGLILVHSAINLLQLRVVDISAESVLYRFHIDPEAVRCELHAIGQPGARNASQESHRKKLHQFLSEVGVKALRTHLGQVLGVARIAKTREQYEENIEVLFGDDRGS